MSDSESSIHDIVTVLDFYRGDFLQNLTLRSGREFEAWVVVERERLRQLAVEGVKRVVKEALANADYPLGIRFARQWLDLDPLSEEAHRQMMWLRMRNGERHLALEQYAACVRMLAQEFSVEPTGRTRAVYERAVAMPAFGRNNFPVADTPFLGRQAELDDLQLYFTEPHNRLVTLLGPGGIGKTRLALAYGQQVLENTPGRFLDGFFFVSLAAAYSTKAAIFAIANAIGLTLSSTRQPLQQLLDFLRHREVLLILDNVEQLVRDEESIAEVVEALLREAPGIRLVVTSREALRLSNEVIFDVEGLPVVAEDSWQEEDGVPAGSAVEFYISQVRRLFRGFRPDRPALQAIVKTCRLLEGVPLGIELAAAWARQYPPQEIAVAVAESLDFLTTPYRNVPSRQHSLRAAFDYSWQLLDAEEKSLLAALSIFLGEFTEEAAQLAGATPALLSRLRNKSLLRQSTRSMYSLHDIVRHYAAEKLAAKPMPNLESAYANYYADLASGFDRLEHYPSFQARLEILRPQFANVLQAWEWLLDQLTTVANTPQFDDYLNQVEKMRRPLRSYFLATSQFYAGYDCFHEATRRLQTAGWDAGTVAQRTLVAKLAIHDVDFARIMGDYHRAISVTEPLLEVLEADQADADLASALLLLKESYVHVGREKDAQAIIEPLSQAVTKTGRNELIAALVMEQGHQAFRNGAHEEALAYYQEALTRFAPLENPRYAAIIHDYMGQIFAARGDLPKALDSQEHALKLAREASLTYREAVIMINLTRVYYELGRVGEAFTTIREARLLLLKLNQRGLLVVAMVVEGDLLAEEKDWEAATALYRDGLCQALATEVDVYMARALSRVPHLLGRQGKRRQARQLAQYVRNHPSLAKVDQKWVNQVEEKTDIGELDDEPFAGKSLAEVGAHILRTAFPTADKPFSE